MMHAEGPVLERSATVLVVLSVLALLVGLILAGWWILGAVMGTPVALSVLFIALGSLLQWVLFRGLAAALRGIAALLAR